MPFEHVLLRSVRGLNVPVQLDGEQNFRLHAIGPPSLAHVPAGHLPPSEQSAADAAFRVNMLRPIATRKTRTLFIIELPSLKTYEGLSLKTA